MWSFPPYMPITLASCGLKLYNGTMFVNVTGKYVRKVFFAALICLSLIGNCVYGTVLCFGADGHVEFESAFHVQCEDHVHSQPADHGRHFSEGEHEHDKHCHSGQCVDVPVSFGLAKILQTSEQLNPTFAALTADVIVSVEHSSASNACFVTSYFGPLRTVILLV